VTLTFRGGRLPNDPAKPRLMLGRYLTGAALPAAPQRVNWDVKVSAFGMLGNDSWGDCHWAASSHTLQTLTANAGTEIAPTTADTLKAYAEATGFNQHAGPPGSNPTDQGTVMQDGLDYWRKTGLPVGAARHKIVAFAQVDHRNTSELEQAIALFGEILLGIQFPAAAMDQFNAGQPWDVVKGSPIEGGHAICTARYDANSRTPWTVVTWGKEQPVTQAFMDAYLEEAWAVVSQEWVSATGLTPSGLNLQTFGEDFATLTGEPNPFPGSNPPEPPPRPGSLGVAVQALLDDPQVPGFLRQRHTGLTKHVASLVAAIRAAA
jgi:hypothetical protein